MAEGFFKASGPKNVTNATVSAREWRVRAEILVSSDGFKDSVKSFSSTYYITNVLPS